MRKMTELFLIDGQPILAPDGDMALALEDVEASDSGWDESAVYHRFVRRYGVGKWSFSYDRLTQEEYAYMESLFAGKESFRFTYPSHTDPAVPVNTTAYRSKHGFLCHCLTTGQLREYQFTVTQC